MISLNAKNGNLGVKNIESFVNAQKADVVLLQEYGGNRDYHFEGLKRFPDTAIVAVFSKFKIIQHKGLVKSNFDHTNVYVSQTDIDVNGNICRFINVHLQPFRFEKKMINLGENDKQGEEKLKNIVKRLIPVFKIHQDEVANVKKAVENSPYPVILAGDFNSVPNSYEYYHLLNGMQDCFVEAGKGSATSFHDYKFPIRIDYIFASKSIKPISYKVDRSVKISDHFPVIATFKLEK
ncbi:hypothetical protein GCM10023210_20270 [Chryseobacterium ginsengisoli]|uniref:Endonuclease/exonuclease/phosphatase domain-containing protein n=1 Tax=Chryseobacterium ginsengisoli TaxID=363853 RepID=A0ABP9M7G8_9FLAO